MRCLGQYWTFLLLIFTYDVPTAALKYATRMYVLKYAKSQCSQPGGLQLGLLTKEYDTAECALKVESSPECLKATTWWVKDTKCVCMLAAKENADCNSRTEDTLSMVYEFEVQREDYSEHCESRGGVPLNFEFVLGQQKTLREKGYTACALTENDVTDQKKFAACLSALGFDGYKYRGRLTDWTCADPNNVRSCGGLACTDKYVGDIAFECRKSIEIPRTNQIHYQAAVNAKEPDLSLFPATGGQGFYVPTGCNYDPRWNPDYTCVGGQEWHACGSPCIRTCHYKPDPKYCSPRCFRRCQCPPELPVWDRIRGCLKQAECDKAYGGAEGETLEQIYNPIREAQPFPYGWSGKKNS